MKITVERDALAPALDLASACIVRKPIQEILSCFRMEAGDGRLKVSANALDCSIDVTVPAEVQRPGVCAVVADKLRALVKAASSGAQMEIDADPAGATVRNSRARYRLQVLPRELFPEPLPLAPDGAVYVEIAAREAKRLFARPMPFVPTEDKTTPTLHGLWVHVHDGRLWSFAASRAMFHATSIPLTAEVGAFEFPGKGTDLRPGIVVPTITGDGLLRALEQGGRIGTNGRAVEVVTPTLRYCGLLMINEFPDVWKFRPPPDPEPERVVVARDELSAAIKRLGLVETERSWVRLTAAPGDDDVVLEMINGGGGEGVERVRMAEACPRPFTTHLRAANVAKMLGAMERDLVGLTAASNANGSSVHVEDIGDDGFAALIMSYTPVRADPAPSADGAAADEDETEDA